MFQKRAFRFKRGGADAQFLPGGFELVLCGLLIPVRSLDHAGKNLEAREFRPRNPNLLFQRGAVAGEFGAKFRQLILFFLQILCARPQQSVELGNGGLLCGNRLFQLLQIGVCLRKKIRLRRGQIPHIGMLRGAAERTRGSRFQLLTQRFQFCNFRFRDLLFMQKRDPLLRTLLQGEFCIQQFPRGSKLRLNLFLRAVQYKQFIRALVGFGKPGELFFQFVNMRGEILFFREELRNRQPVQVRFQKFRFLPKKSFGGGNNLVLLIHLSRSGGNCLFLIFLFRHQLFKTLLRGFRFPLERLQLIAQQFDRAENRADSGIRLMHRKSIAQ